MAWLKEYMGWRLQVMKIDTLKERKEPKKKAKASYNITELRLPKERKQNIAWINIAWINGDYQGVDRQPEGRFCYYQLF